MWSGFDPLEYVHFVLLRAPEWLRLVCPWGAVWLILRSGSPFCQLRRVFRLAKDSLPLPRLLKSDPQTKPKSDTQWLSKLGVEVRRSFPFRPMWLPGVRFWIE